MAQKENLSSTLSVILIATMLCRSSEGTTYDMETKLINYLLKPNRTSIRIRPVENRSQTINVTMDMTLSNVIDIDEKHQIFTSCVWLRQKWINERMKWNPDDFGGIKSVTLSASDIWQPDTVLYNNVFEEFDGRMDHAFTRVRVQHDGSTQWKAPFIFKTLCKIRVKNFPFDLQNCKLKFGSWEYDGSEMDLHYVKSEGKLDVTRVKNGEWDVIKVSITRNPLVYPCCPDVVYPDITFIVQLRRRSLFYMINLIIPNFLIALLAFFSFYIPIECGERISFVITVLLSMTVFLLLVAESIPSTSDAVPAIALYYTSSIILVALALVATGVTLRINYSYMPSSGAKLSKREKRFIFNKLGPCLGFHSAYPVRQFQDGQVVDDDDRPISCCRSIVQRINTSEKSLNDNVTVHFKTSTCSNHLAERNERDERRERGTPTFEHESVTFDFKGGESNDSEQNKYSKDSISGDIRIIAQAIETQKEEEKIMAESRLAAAIVDRAFMCLFIIVFVVSTLIILLLPYLTSEQEQA